MRPATIDLPSSLTDYGLLIEVMYCESRHLSSMLGHCCHDEVPNGCRAFLRGYSESGVNRQKVAETASGLGLAGRYVLASSQAHSTYGRMRTHLPSRRENEIKRTDKTPHHHVPGTYNDENAEVYLRGKIIPARQQSRPPSLELITYLSRTW